MPIPTWFVIPVLKDETFVAVWEWLEVLRAKSEIKTIENLNVAFLIISKVYNAGFQF